MARFEIIYDWEDPADDYTLHTFRATAETVNELAEEIERIKADGGYDLEVIDNTIITD